MEDRVKITGLVRKSIDFKDIHTEQIREIADEISDLVSVSLDQIIGFDQDHCRITIRIEY